MTITEAFLPLHNGQTTPGEAIGIVGWHNHRDPTDALWIYGRGDCPAVRLLGDGSAGPGGLVRECSGELAGCLADLLALPAPNAPRAPRLIRARRPSLWPP